MRTLQTPDQSNPIEMLPRQNKSPLLSRMSIRFADLQLSSVEINLLISDAQKHVGLELIGLVAGTWASR